MRGQKDGKRIYKSRDNSQQDTEQRCCSPEVAEGGNYGVGGHIYRTSRDRVLPPGILPEGIQAQVTAHRQKHLHGLSYAPSSTATKAIAAPAGASSSSPSSTSSLVPTSTSSPRPAAPSVHFASIEATPGPPVLLGILERPITPPLLGVKSTGLSQESKCLAGFFFLCCCRRELACTAASPLLATLLEEI